MLLMSRLYIVFLSTILFFLFTKSLTNPAFAEGEVIKSNSDKAPLVVQVYHSNLAR